MEKGIQYLEEMDLDATSKDIKIIQDLKNQEKNKIDKIELEYLNNQQIKCLASLKCKGIQTFQRCKINEGKCMCDSTVIEDVDHFLNNCPHLNTPRLQLLEDVNKLRQSIKIDSVTKLEYEILNGISYPNWNLFSKEEKKVKYKEVIKYRLEILKSYTTYWIERCHIFSNLTSV